MHKDHDNKLDAWSGCMPSRLADVTKLPAGHDIFNHLNPSCCLPNSHLSCILSAGSLPHTCLTHHKYQV